MPRLQTHRYFVFVAVVAGKYVDMPEGRLGDGRRGSSSSSDGARPRYAVPHQQRGPA